MVRQPGFEPGLGAWGAPVLDQARPQPPYLPLYVLSLQIYCLWGEQAIVTSLVVVVVEDSCLYVHGFALLSQ
jgi:hypothetical protein